MSIEQNTNCQVMYSATDELNHHIITHLPSRCHCVASSGTTILATATTDQGILDTSIMPNTIKKASSKVPRATTPGKQTNAGNPAAATTTMTADVALNIKADNHNALIFFGE